MNTTIAKEQDTSSPHSKYRLFGRQDLPVPEGGLFASVRKQKLLVSLLLIAVTLLLYAPLKEHKFINYDDPAYVTSNLRVQQGLSWKNVIWSFKTTSVANWHPLTWIFYLLDCQLFGLNPAGHHFTNLLLHVINVVVLFLLLHRGTGALWRSAFVAALFALHPLNVESVAWVAELKNVLSTLFWLLTIWVYGWYARNVNWKRYLVVVVLFALGLMAKPMLVTLPFVLLLLDYWPLQRMRLGHSQDSNPQSKDFFALILEKVPLILLSVASSVITVIAQKSGGALAPASAIPLRARIFNALFAYADYIVKMFWPQNLAVFYPIPTHGYPWWQLTVATLLIAVITAIVLKARDRRYLLVCWLWYLGTLVPVIGLVQVGGQSMADRYAYVPLIAIFLMIVWSAAEWAMGRKFLQHALSVAAICILIVISLAARHQIIQWHDDFILFTNILKNSPRNPIAHNNLGTALANSGRLDEAAPHFYAAEVINPQDAEVHYNLGRYFLQKGKPDQAIPEYGLCLYWTGNQTLAAKARFDLGLAFSQTHQVEQAKANYRAAIKLNTESPQAYVNLGVILYSEKKTDEAMGLFTQALQVQQDALAYFWMGRILQDENKLPEALKAYRAALTASPNLVMAQHNIDSILQTQNFDQKKPHN
ncbi:MAG TPA: tetratricopeptide repeat protein [Terriglobales bacterium]|nr:tetratricopeptide repeat protein [Terriglobales bacterium]